MLSAAAFPIRRPATLLAVLGTAALTLLAALPMPVSAATDTCDRVAAANGSDSAAGTAAAPFRTGQQLASSLGPGQVGCVRGTLAGDVTVVRPDITLTSEPGQRGKLVGKLWIAPEGPRATIRDLDLDGRRTNGIVISPIVTGDDALFTGNDITNAGAGICFIIGSSGHDGDVRAERTRIEGNRIHDCGTSNNHQHGIYVEHALDTRIVGNEIYDNADRGIQLYPYAVNTTIAGNVIDGNGEGIAISGYGDRATRGTRVYGNLITNSRIRAGVESYFPGVDGTDNLVEGNCFAGPNREIDLGGGGFVARNNVFEEPQYVDRGAKDFRLREGSPCAELLDAARAGAPIPPLPTGTSGDGDTSDDDTSAAPVRPAGSTGTATGEGTGAKGTTGAAKRTSAATKKARASRVRLRLARSKKRRWARVHLRLVGADQSARALVEVRTAGGRWRAVAAPRLAAQRVKVLALRLPRGGRKIEVRAALVSDAQPVVVAFRAVRRRASTHSA